VRLRFLKGESSNDGTFSIATNVGRQCQFLDQIGSQVSNGVVDFGNGFVCSNRKSSPIAEFFHTLPISFDDVCNLSNYVTRERLHQIPVSVRQRGSLSMVPRTAHGFVVQQRLPDMRINTL
jgi:hypothetical protein